MRVDLVLSSGFLAFSRHCGFLAAVEEAGLEVGAVGGTSSGAVVGALWAAGHRAADIGRHVRGQRPLWFARPSVRPWTGLGSLSAFERWLEGFLPPRFSDLRHPLALGVVTRDGQHRLVTEGPLARAVTASCAMPWVFSPVEVEGQVYADGGAGDRLGLGAFRSWRPGTHVLAHWVERTAGRDVEADVEDVTVVRTPRSGASFFSLGAFDAQVDEARRITRAAIPR
jgi:NTE family protein